jgi:hypothetical protein
MQYPQWATPQRQALLVELFQRSRLVWLSPDSPIRGFCMDSQCSKVSADNPAPFCQECERFFQNYIEPIIKDWIADDKLEQTVLWRRERRELHHMSDERGWRHQIFDPVAKDVFFQQQPPYYLEGVGISGLTFTRIAKVRVPSTPVRLYVDVADSKLPKKLGQNARKRAKRQAALQIGEDKSIDTMCRKAVRHFKDSLE